MVLRKVEEKALKRTEETVLRWINGKNLREKEMYSISKVMGIVNFTSK